jgi:hypothetical protein
VILLGSGGTLCAALGVYLATIDRRSGPRPGQADQRQPRHWPVVAGAAAAALGLTHQCGWVIAAGVVATVAASSPSLFTRRS